MGFDTIEIKLVRWIVAILQLKLTILPYFVQFLHLKPGLLNKNAAKRSTQHARIQWRSSFTEGRLPLKVIFQQRSSSTGGRLPPEVVFHRWSSSTEGCLPPTITPWLILYLWQQSTYQISASYLQCMMHDAWCNTLVDLIFVRTDSIPNLSLLPC